MNYVDRVAPYGTTPPPEPVAGRSASSPRSGTVAWTMNQMATDRGVGLRIILGVGNEAVLGLGDLFEWAAADPKTKVVTSYVETMRDVEGIGRGLDALRGRAQAGPDLRAGGPERGGAPLDRRAHRRARRQHGAPRRLAPRTRRGPRGGPGDDVRGGGAALASPRSAHRRRRCGAAVGRRVHPVRRGGRRGGASAAGVLAGRRGRRSARRCRSFASQNNPLDVTGQAAVETDMFVRALDALASDPSVGFVAFDAFPPRDGGRGVVGGAGLAQRATSCSRRRGSCSRRSRMSPLDTATAAKAFVGRRAAAVPAGAPGCDRRDPRADRSPGGRAAGGADLAAAPEPREAIAAPARHAPVRSTRRRARGCSSSTAFDVRRSGWSRRRGAAAAAARTIGFPVAVKALAPELPHKAKLGGVRLGSREPDRRGGGRGRGARRRHAGPARSAQGARPGRW